MEAALEVATPRYESLVEVLAHLDGVAKVGNGWMARCPAHDDQHPSLSITEGYNGRLLAKCHRGCSFELIIKAIRQRMDVGFKPDITPAIAPILALPRTGPEQEGENGWPWWIRKTGIPQEFWQTLGTTLVNGRIAFKYDDDMTKVRYNLSKNKYHWIHPTDVPTPDFWPPIAPPASTLIITEGESDCATLRYSLGERLGKRVYAYTKGAGANGSKFLNTIAAWAPGRKILLCFDEDEIGRKAMSEAVRLAPGMVKDIPEIIPVRLSELSPEFPGKDVNELYHHLGREREELAKLFLPLLEPPKQSDAWGAISWQDLMAKDCEQNAWIIPGVMRQGWTVMFAGPGKHGKTTLGMHMLNQIRTGGYFISPIKEPLPTVYFNYEMGESDLQDLLLEMQPDPEGEPGMILATPTRPLRSVELERWLKAQPKPGVAIFDCVRAAFGFATDEEKDASAVGARLRPLHDVAMRTHWTLVFIHHFTKASTGSINDVAGSAEFVNAVDLIMTWVRPDPMGAGTLHLEGRIPPQEDQAVMLTRNTVQFLGARSVADVTLMRAFVNEHLTTNPDGAVSIKDMQDLAGEGIRASRGDWFTYLLKLVDEGRVKRVAGSVARFYAIPLTAMEQWDQLEAAYG